MATDGSETSNQALIEARNLAECSDSEVKIIHVQDILTKSFMGDNSSYIRDLSSYQVLVEHEEKASKLLLADALKIFEGFSGEVSAINRVGDAAKEILKEAKEGSHDLIVMGSCGTGAFSRTKIMVGSVCNKVLNLSDVNVLTIR